MSKTLFNFWLDALLLVLFMSLVGVAAIVQFVFPPPVSADGWTLWGGSLGWWMGLQFGLLCAFGLAVLLHVMMHWSWVCGVVSTKLSRSKSRMDDGIQTIVGVGVLIVLLHVVGAFVFAAWITIQRPSARTSRAVPAIETHTMPIPQRVSEQSIA